MKKRFRDKNNKTITMIQFDIMDENTYQFLKQLMNEHPNDYDLGSVVRKLVIERELREIELSMVVSNILESKNKIV